MTGPALAVAVGCTVALAVVLVALAVREACQAIAQADTVLDPRDVDLWAAQITAADAGQIIDEAQGGTR